jgi:hypothetical protein
MPMSEDLKRLLGGAFKLEANPKEKPKKAPQSDPLPKKETEIFRSKRFPTYLKSKRSRKKE